VTIYDYLDSYNIEEYKKRGGSGNGRKSTSLTSEDRMRSFNSSHTLTAMDTLDNEEDEKE
jgi:hypothetical protein